MGSGTKKATTKRTETIERKNRFRKWKNNGYQPIIDTTGEEISIEQDERFVALVYPTTSISEFKPDYGLYVSNYGKLVSFKRGGDAKLIKLSLNNKDNPKGHLAFGRGGKYIHIAVWYSFAHEALTENGDMPQYFKEGERITSLKDLKTIVKETYGKNFKGIRKTNNTCEVHHKDINPHNNRLDNLILTQKDLHKPYLHSIFDAPDENKKWEKFTATNVSLPEDENGQLMPQIVSEYANGIAGEHITVAEFREKYPSEWEINTALGLVINYIDHNIPGYFIKERKVCIGKNDKVEKGFYVKEGIKGSIDMIPDELPIEDYDVVYERDTGYLGIDNRGDDDE